MINDKLVWYLESNNILTDIQCGFRKHKSTLYHLVRLESFIRDHAFLINRLCLYSWTLKRHTAQLGNMEYLKIYTKWDNVKRVYVLVYF